MEILERWERNNFKELEKTGDRLRRVGIGLLRIASLAVFLVYLILRAVVGILRTPNIVRERGPGLPPERRDEFERPERHLWLI